MRRSILSAASLMVSIALCAKAAQAQDRVGWIVPKYGECTLEIDGRAVKPVEHRSPWRERHIVGELSIWVEGASVKAMDRRTLAVAWSATPAPDGRNLRWLSADDERGYLTGLVPSGPRQPEAPETPARVRVLDLKTGSWLEDLKLEVDPPGEQQAQYAAAALIGGTRVVVFIPRVIDNAASYERHGSLVGYSVACYERGMREPLWTRTFAPSGPAGHRATAFLLSATRPRAAGGEVQPLCWIGENILVCAGPQQRVECLAGSDGGTVWTIDRPWEYERGFIGPSVWSHVMSRFGSEEWIDHEIDQEARRAFDERFVCSIVGGPVVVPVAAAGAQDGSSEHRVFIAVKKSDNRAWPEYVSDCFILEFLGGSPLAIAPMPSMVIGHAFSTSPGKLIWACQDRGFACFQPVKDVASVGLLGGPNHVASMAWYRQVAAPSHPAAWIDTGTAGDPVAFGAGMAFRLPEGGYELSSTDRVYRFPLSMVDLETGVDRSAVLCVPHDGQLDPGASGRWSYEPDGGTRRSHFSGPHLLAITGLSVEGDRLVVTLATENGADALEFNIADLSNTDE